MRTFLRIALLTLLLLLTGLPLAAKVLSHADYARSQPAADEVLAAPPEQVQVWFTQELFRREGENWLRVTGPNGARVDGDDAAVDDDDRTLLAVSLSPGLPDGAYRVEWRALSADDGHPKEGEFAFQIAANPAPPQSAPPQSAPTQSAPTSTPTPQPTVAPASPTAPSAPSSEGGLPCLGAAPLALLAVGSVLARKRRSH